MYWVSPINKFIYSSLDYFEFETKWASSDTIPDSFLARCVIYHILCHWIKFRAEFSYTMQELLEQLIIDRRPLW